MKKLFFAIVFLSTLYLVLGTALAQDFNFTKARADYVFIEDIYKSKLETFNLRKDSYQKNPTLSLKEEARIALLDFLGARNDLVKSYLTMLRVKTLESEGLTIVEKQNLYSKIDSEVVWFNGRKTSYQTSDPVESLIAKSKEEDEQYKLKTLPIIYYSLSYISLGEVLNLKTDHVAIYKTLKSEALDLVKLGRADSTLFDRWFTDIDGELTKIDDIEKATRVQIEKIFAEDSFERDSSYQNVIEILEPVKSNLLKLNQFIKELETTIETKR